MILPFRIIGHGLMLKHIVPWRMFSKLVDAKMPSSMHDVDDDDQVTCRRALIGNCTVRTKAQMCNTIRHIHPPHEHRINTYLPATNKLT